MVPFRRLAVTVCSIVSTILDFAATPYVPSYCGLLAPGCSGKLLLVAAGLGFDAQQAVVKAHLGADWPPVASYTEVESGKHNDMLQLTAALARCKCIGAVLVIAKLDRLARNVHFIGGLMKSGVEFVCAGMPTVNRRTIHVLAAVAEEEARAISSRTKAALAAWEARHPEKRLGNPNGWQDTSLGTKAQAKRAAEFAAKYGPTIQTLRSGGMKPGDITTRMTQMGIPTPRKGVWTAMTVCRVFAPPPRHRRPSAAFPEAQNTGCTAVMGWKGVRSRGAARYIRSWTHESG
jgi:DNA invertase Pin-like site-specific DNA recombinase